MKQKFLCLCILFLSCVFVTANAQTVPVRSMDTFSTENPPAAVSVEILEPLEVNDDLFIEAGTIVKGNLVDVVSPKRLKRDASFSFIPEEFTDETGKNLDIDVDLKASYAKPLDKGKIAKNVVLSVGNFFVKGFKIAANVITGTVKNEQGNRLKSAGVSLYESTPISYAKKGEDLYINKSDVFYLKFSK